MENNQGKVGLTTRQRRDTDLTKRVQGWGADLDPAVRPGVPMDKAPFIGRETLYPNIERQLSDVEILKSIEHEQMPPVYGTTCPPKGLSGMLRRWAFQSSEGQFNHWLSLLGADRIDMIESDLADLLKGRVPNLWHEMGLSAEWKYNRKAFVQSLALTGVGAAAIAGAVVLYRRSQKTGSKRSGPRRA